MSERPTPGKADPRHACDREPWLWGAERLLYTNLKNFNRVEFRHTVLMLFSRDPHWLEPIRDLGIDVINLGCRNYRDLGMGTWRLWLALRKVRPDLIHTHLWAADLVGRIAGGLAGIPVISSIHNMDYDPESRAEEGRALKYKREAALILDRWTARFGCRPMIAVSKYVSSSASHFLRYPPGLIDTVHNPIDFEELGTTQKVDREHVLADLGLPSQSLVLLNMGRVVSQKGLLFAILALPEIIARYSMTHLVSVGSLVDQDYVATLQGEAERLGVSALFHTVSGSAWPGTG